MTAITNEEKIATQASGFFSFGAWGAIILITSIVNGIIGLTTNALNISNSAKMKVDPPKKIKHSPSIKPTITIH